MTIEHLILEFNSLLATIDDHFWSKKVVVTIANQISLSLSVRISAQKLKISILLRLLFRQIIKFLFIKNNNLPVSSRSRGFGQILFEWADFGARGHTVRIWGRCRRNLGSNQLRQRVRVSGWKKNYFFTDYYQCEFFYLEMRQNGGIWSGFPWSTWGRDAHPGGDKSDCCTGRDRAS